MRVPSTGRVVILAAVAGSMFIGACTQIILPPPDKKVRAASEAGQKRLAELERIAEWMVGTFDSTAQAAVGNEYKAIVIHSGRIWANRIDGPWVYVEHAAIGEEDKPYRQRVCRLNLQENGLLVCEVYSFPSNPMKYVGAWQNDTAFDDVTPKDLAFQNGCTVVLKKVNTTTYKGSTVGQDCANELQGAVYSTAEITLTPDGIDAWDRGFDKQGKQVWGAQKGPYQFRRAGR